MSGSTSPQQSVPTLLYSQNSQPLDHYENNNDNKPVQIKSEYDYRYDIDSTVSSVESSPHIVAANEFETSSQFTYNYPPPLCDDSSSEPLSSATSPTVPTGGDLAFALSPDSLSQYYSIIQSTPLDQNSGVQPSFTDQMRFIIYEPRQNENVSLINAPNNYQMPMWQIPLPTSGIDNRPITTVASTQSSLNLPYDYSQNQVLVNPAQINPLPPAHLRSHSPARPYQCPMCPRSFSRKHDLQRHIRVHTGVKPYQCPCCRKAFARTDALRRHFKMEETCRNSPEVQNMKTRRRYSEMH
ncbi:15240_t:CDS:2 [Funneliformis geosporum]|uniref:15240_t:CDS:1 n=1 Tax=Funneliformis geosporum TaxID=1117311 RepID=A0A9W4SII8_9GLOM|nr:15240_t:CDS:2 [Funneliformis geosporum]